MGDIVVWFPMAVTLTAFGIIYTVECLIRKRKYNMSEVTIRYQKKGKPVQTIEFEGGKLACENMLRDIRVNKKGEVLSLSIKNKGRK